MPDATHAQTSFLGGQISSMAEGRFDLPVYKTSMRICLNAYPTETGAWTRRPGSAYAGHTRGGGAGRVISFDFEDANPVTLEFTDGRLRFRNGTALISTNDVQSVVSVSAANPAVVQVQNAVNWATGDTVIFPGASTPLLENRQFTLARIDNKNFSIADALTGVNIDGSTLGALAAGATVAHIHEVQTVYLGTSWSSVRAVQAETTDILLAGSLPPQALTLATEPSAGINAQFAISAAVFNDGPYLDPPTNGVQVTPSALSGLINLTLSFPQYSAATAYSAKSFVTYAGNNYVSLIDQNVGNTPASSPTAWALTSAGAAINNGKGFLGSDIGRLVRLLNEPAAWAPGTSYSAGKVVSYNPTGIPGATTYWQSLTTTTGDAPGTDLTNWELIAQGAAIWTWGKIVGLSNIIDRQLAGSVATGSMTLFNGVTAPFDGQFTKVTSQCAALSVSGGLVNGSVTLSGYVGKNFTGSGPQQIQQATVYPSTDDGFGFGEFVIAGVSQRLQPFYTLNLRGKQGPPSGSSDGTLLGSISFSGSSVPTTILSNDQSTAWDYVWIELVMTQTVPSVPASSYDQLIDIAQISFFSPTSSSSTAGAGCQVEILGPSLLYAQPIATWRLGVYSATTGYPTCGCYAGGRLFLGGAVANRWDACFANGINGGTVNWAPTDQNGVVGAAHAISYTLNSDAVNPIFGMIPVQEGVIMMTQGGEWLVFPPGNGALAPNNVDSRRLTRIGARFVQPIRTEHTNIFVQRYGVKLMEYFADVFSGRYSAPNIAERAQDIVRPGISELAYTYAFTPIAWGRGDDLSLFGITYKRTTLTTSEGPTYAGWHTHALGSGRTVESICSGPSPNDFDALTMVTNDNTTGIRHVEVLTDEPAVTASLASAWFLDDAVNPTSVSSSSVAVNGAPYGGLTINGLWHLNGKTVQVFAGGLDCGDVGFRGADYRDFVVTNGSVFVPYGDGVALPQGTGSGRGQFTAAFAAALPLSQIVVGMTYNSDGQIVPPMMPSETGSRNGPAFGAVTRGHRVVMKLVNALGLSIGTDFTKLLPATLKQKDGVTAWPSNQVYNGIHYETLNDDYDRDRPLCWRVSRPFPCTITVAGSNRATQDQ